LNIFLDVGIIGSQREKQSMKKFNLGFVFTGLFNKTSVCFASTGTPLSKM
jgi:hypothetical protein